MSPTDREAGARKHARAPVAVEVHYRTSGSFLVSYSLNLSMGGLFMETDEPLEPGSSLLVRFAVPGQTQTAETTARVVWRRQAGQAEGLPGGMGLSFEQLDEEIGSLIDALVRDFRGVRMVALGGDAATLTKLSRYLNNILVCEVTGISPAQLAQAGVVGTPELVLIDLDSMGQGAFDALESLCQNNPTVPLLVLCSDQKQSSAALKLGVAGVVENPPVFEVLRRAVLEAVARPVPPRLTTS